MPIAPGAKRERELLEWARKLDPWVDTHIIAERLCELLKAAIALDDIDCITVRHIDRDLAASSPGSHPNELSEQDPTPSPSEGDPPLELMPDGYDHPDCICTETVVGKQCPVKGHMPPALMGLKWECDSCGKPWHTFANGQPIGACQCGSTSARFVELVCIDDPIAGEGDET